MGSERVKCGICDTTILPATAQANGGLCAQCVKIPPAKRSLAAAVHAETNPLDRAIELYSSLLDSLATESTSRFFGGIADPEFQGFRFYCLDAVGKSFDYDESTEVGAETVDEIEYYLLAAESEVSLLLPIATRLRSLSQSFNSNGRTLFLGSWGMGHGEIAWLVRFLNDRPTFERFLGETGITEDELDVFNDAYTEELTEAEQVVDDQSPIRRGVDA